MPGKETDDPIIGTIITVVTLSSGLPAIPLLYRQHRIFDCACSVLLFFSSMLYHLSEAWKTNELFLNEMQWHRLDNISVLACIGNTFIYLADFENETHAELLRWVEFFIILIVQEKDPWNPLMTAGPVVLFLLLPLVKYFHAFVTSRSHGSYVPRFLWRNLWVGLGLLIGLGGPCFVLGLDDQNDPYRIFHFLWHVWAGVSFVYLNQTVIPRRFKKSLFEHENNNQNINKQHPHVLDHNTDHLDRDGSRSRSISIGSELGYNSIPY